MLIPCLLFRLTYRLLSHLVYCLLAGDTIADKVHNIVH